MQRGREGGGGTNVPKNDACQQMITIFKIEKKRLSHSLHDLRKFGQSTCEYSHVRRSFLPALFSCFNSTAVSNYG